MRILLVNPSARVWQQTKIIPLGLGYIAAVLEKAGHSVKVIDLNHEPSFVIPEGIDLVGITAATSTIEYAWEVARLAKGKNLPTVFGGPHVTCQPDESLQRPEVDFLVRGEGEETVVELVSALERGEPLAKVRGLSFKENGRIVHNEARPYIRDLDKLPFPAYHLFPPIKHYVSAQPFLSRRDVTASIMTSRGCPFNCIFCYKGMFGYAWRYRSPENIAAEWKFLVEDLKVGQIRIQDDIFNENLPRAEKICDLISSGGKIVPWSVPNGIRADRVTETLISKMKQSGCFQVAFGVESGDQEILKKIDKKLDLAEVEKSFSLLHKYKLESVAFFVIGNPGETEATIRKTIDFAVRLDPDIAQFTMATPYPGTRLYELIKKENSFLSKDWREYGHYTPNSFYAIGELTPELLKKMMRLAYLKFYLRPGHIIRFLLKRSTWFHFPIMMRSVAHAFLKLFATAGDRS